MKARPIITLAIGVVLAGAAVFFVSRALDGQRAQSDQVAQAPFPVTSIVVASTDLKFGSRIGAEHLKLVSWPKDSVPSGAFTSISDILGDRSQDRVAIRGIASGEPVVAAKVSGFGGRATMSTLIPEDKRAFAIQVNAVSGVAGFLLPGDRVDVLLTRQIGQGSENQVTDVVLQDVMVRGVDQDANEAQSKPQVVRTVTVEVTPEQAQKLALAMRVGSLTLALRNMLAIDKADTRTIHVHDLASERKPKPDGTVYVRPSVKVRRGSEVSTVSVAR